MQRAKHIISPILVVLVLLSGLPVFSPEDANRDISVDLKDAVMQVMDFARTADEPHTFAVRVQKALSTLHVVAGLKTVIKQANDKNSATNSISSDFPCIISLYNFSEPLLSFAQVPEKTVFYKTFVVSPDTPPPEPVVNGV
ncbi:MAG: hypothetical protein GY749_41540 [Desulfobacteraceae bacterium]|nr:hypothetical protein [Desulfobacteraceae bacterium]